MRILLILCSSIISISCYAAVWERVVSGMGNCTYRMYVPGGWLVEYCSEAITFMPDKDHEWKI